MGHFSSYSQGDRKRDAERRALCSASDDGAGCVDAQFGCAAARLYLRWYPHLATFMTAQTAPAYHSAQGAKLGYSWPARLFLHSGPCDLPRAASPKGISTRLTSRHMPSAVSTQAWL